MANRTSTPRLVRSVVQLADLVLRLRHRHAIAGNDDDAARVAQNLGRLFGAGRTHRPRFACRPSLVCNCPNAPNSTLVNDRFMALHMMIERMKPDDPSSAPAMISSLLSSANPMAQAERPA